MADWPVERDPVFGCWIWTGDVDEKGYGFVWRGPSRVKAHLVVYAENVGPVPANRVLDHNCSRRACVAPHHLEPVTQRENLFRRSWRYRSRIERCKAGHDMRVTSVVIQESNGRVCRTCNRLASDGNDYATRK